MTLRRSHIPAIGAIALALVLTAPFSAAAGNAGAIDRLRADPAGLTAAFRAELAQPAGVGDGILRTVQFDEFDREESDRVSVGKVVGLSLLLPGAGHWTMGSRGRAGIFFGAEAIAWTAFGYFKTVQHQKEDDYELYARAHAGIDPEGKNDEFYRTLTFYMNREQYNDEGRLIDPARPYYPDDPQWDWQWESEAAMGRYRNLRNQSNIAEDRAKYSLGAALLNRLVAAADAWRTARAINRQARMETASWKVRFKGKPSMSNPGFMVMLSRKLY